MKTNHIHITSYNNTQSYHPETRFKTGESADFSFEKTLPNSKTKRANCDINVVFTDGRYKKPICF